MSTALETTTTTKKRRHSEKYEDLEGAPSKKVKKDKSKKHDKKGKGRDTEVDGEFMTVKASVLLSIPPIFAKNYMSGALEMLDSLIMRYVPALGGVMLAYANVKFLSQVAVIKGECPFANCNVGFDATVWSPQIGMKLTGKINLCSPDHISLLVHRTFNVSIPRHHIPTDNWEFVHGPAENDPEFGPNAAATEEDRKDSMAVDALPEGTMDEEEVFSTGGTWIHKITSEQLGGDEGYLQFTVIGLTIANQMLSLVGSLQPDPFSERHVPQPAIGPSTSKGDDRETTEDVANEFAIDEEDDYEEEDPFSMYTRNHVEDQEQHVVEEEEETPKQQLKKDKKDKKRDKHYKVKKALDENPLESMQDKPKKRRKKSSQDV